MSFYVVIPDMFLMNFNVNGNLSVSEIVDRDYRTADIFRKYGISYIGNGNLSLNSVCQDKGLDSSAIIEELELSLRNNMISNRLDFSEWDVVFLVDYIVNVHHTYLKIALVETQELLKEFSKEDGKKLTYISEIEKSFDLLVKRILPAMQQEEEVIFPYIRQIAHAHRHKEPYAALFIRTLRKPVEEIMFKGHKTVTGIITSLRSLTNNYTIPMKSYTGQKVLFSKLKELDDDLMQHLFLEDSVLFPHVMTIEKDLLNN